MRGKIGVFFMLYLVIWTLLMCVTVIGLYNVQQKELSVSLVSPLSVLNVTDGLTLFEMREVSLIKNSLGKTKGVFGTDTFNREFRKNFLDGFSIDSKMTGFILKNLIWKGSIINTGSGFDSAAFYKNILYPSSGMTMSSGKLIFSRARIGKSFSLNAPGADKINFPIDFKFEFERKYIISKVNGRFNVEAA